MERNIFVIFTAGGSGTRMGGSTPKQFLELGGKPILQLTIERFLEAVPQMKPIVVLPESGIEEWKDLCRIHAFNIPHTIVKGGITRFHSVRNALEKVPDGVLVAIQDGVRPFPSVELLKRMFAEAQTRRALVPLVPVTDTLKSAVRNDDGTIVPAEGPQPDRSRIFGAQTPQIFLSEEIKAAYSNAFDTSFTDDASVAEKAGIPVSYTEGERFNIKITTPEDLKLAEWILEKF